MGTETSSGRIYIAPAEAPPPKSIHELEQSATWIDIGYPVTEAARREDEATREQAEAWYSGHLEVTYQMPEPYRPNRATRRALARTTRRGHR